MSSSKFQIDEIVLIDTFDVKGYGRVVENKVGTHILVDGFKEPMYFNENEIKKVKDYEQH